MQKSYGATTASSHGTIYYYDDDEMMMMMMMIIGKGYFGVNPILSFGSL